MMAPRLDAAKHAAQPEAGKNDLASSDCPTWCNRLTALPLGPVETSHANYVLDSRQSCEHHTRADI